MVVTIISWLYIFLVILAIGLLTNKLLYKIIPVPDVDTLGLTGYLVTGLVSVTVYGSYFSIFYKSFRFFPYFIIWI